MKLWIDGHRLTSRRTGVGRVLELLLDEWSAKGWPLPRPTLVTQEPVGPRRWFGLDVVSRGRRLPGVIWRHTVLAPLVQPEDLLFCPTNLLPRTLASRRVLFVFDTLLETVPHTFSNRVRARFRGRYRSSARRASLVLVPSEATRRDVLDRLGVDPGRIRIAPLAVDPIFEPDAAARLTPRTHDPLAVPTLLVVGKRSKRRGFESTLAAFASFREEAPRARLVVVGPGEEPIPSVDGLVAFPHLPDLELAHLYQSAFALIYLSEYEGFGLPIVEAQASGCPVVTSRGGAL
jgi:alpha-1,3-rhamnosyl/mannosyltransferase